MPTQIGDHPWKPRQSDNLTPRVEYIDDAGARPANFTSLDRMRVDEGKKAGFFDRQLFFRPKEHGITSRRRTDTYAASRFFNSRKTLFRGLYRLGRGQVTAQKEGRRRR